MYVVLGINKMSIFIIFITAFVANLIWDIFAYINDISKKDRREKNMSVMTVTLDEFMNERGEWVKQVVYKVDGDFNGNINGDNVTVILMGDGNINGDIKAKNGEVVLFKGNINGDVKADKILCPNEPRKETCEMCKYYAYHEGKHYWCTHGGMCHLCIKDGTVCKYYEDKNNY